MAAHGMRPFGTLLTKEEAMARLLSAAQPMTRAEELALDDAAGRICGEDIHAPFDVPPFARATMDGYALRSADAATPGTALRIVADVFAGAEGPRGVERGEAARIATGAPMPPGADAVVRVEDATESEGSVSFRVAPRVGLAMDPAGVDLARGDLVCARGSALTPARIGLLASIGAARVRVVARPRLALFASGDELLPVGAAPRPFRIYDSNSWALDALFAAHGAQVERHSALPDSLEGIRDALMRAAATHDVIVVTGGASVGAKDLLSQAIEAAGGEIRFHGVRVKPGKPLLVARLAHALLVGLPGNPTSALSNSCLFVVPALRQMARLAPQAPARTQATLTTAVRGEAERFLFLPVRLDGDRATPTFKGSGALTSLAASDGWIGVPEKTDLAAGAAVQVNAWW